MKGRPLQAYPAGRWGTYLGPIEWLHGRQCCVERQEFDCTHVVFTGGIAAKIKTVNFLAEQPRAQR